MPAKGDRKPRICRVCNTTDETKFHSRRSGICKACVSENTREKSRIASAKWRAKNPDKVKNIRLEHVTYNREYGWKLRDDLRREVLAHYSPVGILGCSWENCEVRDSDMLVLDHVANDGAAQRRSLGGSKGRGWNFYRWLKKHNFPDGYQTLCCNHNHKKEMVRNRDNRSF
jgi:hypothetical protein